MTTRTVTLEIEIPVPQLTLETALWGLVVAAIAADLITTQVGLAHGFTESNPTARNALKYGTVGFLVMKGGAVGVGLLCRSLLEADHRWIVPAALSLPWLLAALWNATLIAGVLA